MDTPETPGGKTPGESTDPDATERVRLRLSEERFRSLVLATSQMVFLLNPAGGMQEDSESWRAYTGQTPEQARGRGWQDAIHPDDHSRFMAEWERANASPKAINFECRISGAQGQIQHFSVCAAPIFNGSRIREWMAACIDITERVQLDEHARKSRRMEALGQLAGGVAHDFNNLLTIINGRAELLIAEFQARGASTRELEVIHKTGERAANLTRQLLAFSRRQVMQPKVLSINAVIDDLLEILQRLVPGSVRIATELDPRAATVLADPTQIEQVLINLIVNARDAMPDGGIIAIGTANIKVRDSKLESGRELKKGAYVLLTVADTGCGMDAATKSRIFEPFFTTKPKGSGTGLGMSTVFGIVKQSGGQIEVDSAPGNGTTIKIFLPVSVGKNAQASGSSLAPMAAGVKTILVVEDEGEIRDFVCEILCSSGYRVLSSPNAEDALANHGAGEGAIDLVLTDVMLPGLNGYELVERLKKTRPALRAVYTSGHVDHGVQQGGIMYSEAGSLPKPFGRLDLLDKVRAALEPPA